MGESFAPLWSTQGANIYYQDGKVLIGTSNDTSNEDYTLEVAKSLYVQDAIRVGDTGIEIENNTIRHISEIHFQNDDINTTAMTFNGKLSSIRMDYIDDNDNSTWLRRYQSSIGLSGFNNDMDLGTFYKQENKTWFDNPQSSIKLSDFENDIVSQDIMDFDMINVNNIHFLGNSENNIFNGEISTLAGISNFNLSEFNDDIVTKEELSVESMVIQNMDSDIIPSVHNLYDLGESENRFANLYVASNINLGDSNNNASIRYDEQQDKILIDKPILASEGISLGNGGTIKAFGKEGGELNDFECVKLKLYSDGSGPQVYNISGQFNFGVHQDEKIGSELYKLYVYNIDNGDAGILLPDENGDVATNDNDVTTLVHTQNSKYFDFDTIKEDGSAVGNSLYLAPYQPQNANDVFNLRTLIPNSIEFKQKFKADFDYFQNERMFRNPDNRTWSDITPWGYITGEVNLSEYVHFISPSSQSECINKTLVEYISYYVLPSPPTDGASLADYQNAFFASDEMDERLEGNFRYIIYDDDIEQHIIQHNDGFRLYPKITFKDWKNRANDTMLNLTPYTSNIGWYDETNQVVNIEHFEMGWLTKLLELTVSYIKYGQINELTESDQQLIDAKVSQGFTSSDFLILESPFGNTTVKNSIIINPNIFNIDNNNLNF